MDIDNTIELEGIVIRAVEYKESSKILTIITREKGIIGVMAQGVKRPKSGKQNLTSLYVKGQFSLKKLKDMYILLDGEVSDLNVKIREDIRNIYLAQTILEMVEKNLLDGDKNESIYMLVDKSIKYIDTKAKLRYISAFLIKFVSMIGYKPQITKCISCDKDKFTKVSLSPRHGGIICQECGIFENYILTKDEHLYLIDLMYKKFEEIEINDYRVNEKKLLKYLADYYEINTGLPMPKSYEIFYKLDGGLTANG
ncbi:MAG: DNA repair protein RecO [Tissierellia bacterium]|nr:DNA repair protein RecO [Tissierellia bacterium]